MDFTRGLAGFYQSAHGVSDTNGTDPATKLYFAAAENDGLGWEQGQGYLGPMYTMDRRNEEKNEASRDSFFKRLKTRADKEESADGRSVDDERQGSGKEMSGLQGLSGIGTGTGTGAAEPQTKPAVFNGMRFGFGMMKLALPTKKDNREERPVKDTETEAKPEERIKEKGKEKGKDKSKDKSKSKDSKPSTSSDAESDKKSKRSKKEKSDKKRKHK
ncbi:hypothetical protein LPJ75_004325 [Coemansia sp. RSA 2598]|nr:hypothetical protein LPJ75_004325 [Coemansia sp. RSA 2598]